MGPILLFIVTINFFIEVLKTEEVITEWPHGHEQILPNGPTSNANTLNEDTKVKLCSIDKRFHLFLEKCVDGNEKYEWRNNKAHHPDATGRSMVFNRNRRETESNSIINDSKDHEEIKSDINAGKTSKNDMADSNLDFPELSMNDVKQIGTQTSRNNPTIISRTEIIRQLAPHKRYGGNSWYEANRFYGSAGRFKTATLCTGGKPSTNSPLKANTNGSYNINSNHYYIKPGPNAKCNSGSSSYFQNSDDCSTYYKCIQGSMALAHCPWGSYFIPEGMKCEKRVPQSGCKVIGVDVGVHRSTY